MQQLFGQVLSQFQSTHQYDKFIKQVQKQYDVKIYRLATFTRQYAQTIYHQLHHKYSADQYPQLPQGWHQNQRRLYVWFIVCFIHLKMLEPNKLVDDKKYDKYWKNISNTFYHKEIPFLKYQLLTIVKNKGRTSWKKNQDLLLKQAYTHFEKGQWNEVAKYFYFQSRGQFFKTPKQCRQRYQNHLNDNIKKGQWSSAEDKILFEYVKKKGAHWASIIPLLDYTRTQHMIKNRYKSVINKYTQEKHMSEGQAILQALRNCGRPQNRNFDENSMRDQQGILQCQSEQFIDEEQEPPIIQHKKRKEKKRGRPKKIKQTEQIPKEKDAIIIGGEKLPSKNSCFSRKSHQSYGELKVEQNYPSFVDSFSKRNPGIFQNFSHSFNQSRNEFFTSGRFNFNSGMSYNMEDDKNQSLLFDPMQSRIIKKPDNFQSLRLNAQSLNRSNKILFTKNNDSLSGFLQ